MKKLGFLFVTVLFSVCFSALPVAAKVVEVQAIGAGDDEEWALARALENAVRQTSPVDIVHDTPDMRIKSQGSANTDGSYDDTLKGTKTSDLKGKISGKVHTFEGDADVKGVAKDDLDLQVKGKDSKRVLTTDSAATEIMQSKYHGTVLSYKVLNTDKKDGKYYVTVLAKVNQVEAYKPKLDIKKAEAKVVVVPFKVLGIDVDCGTSSKKVTPEYLQGLMQGGLVKNINASGKMQVTERTDFSAYADEMALIQAGVANQDNRSMERQIASADYILTGTIDNFSVKTTKTEIAMLNDTETRTSVKMHVSFRLVETATMEVIYASSLEERMIKKSGTISCNTAADNMMRLVPKEVADKVLAKVFPTYKPEKISKRKFKETFFADNRDEGDEEYEDEMYETYLDADDKGVSVKKEMENKVKKKQSTSAPVRPKVTLPMDE